jgi:hypothetical protein
MLRCRATMSTSKPQPRLEKVYVSNSLLSLTTEVRSRPNRIHLRVLPDVIIASHCRCFALTEPHGTYFLVISLLCLR